MDNTGARHYVFVKLALDLLWGSFPSFNITTESWNTRESEMPESATSGWYCTHTGFLQSYCKGNLMKSVTYNSRRLAVIYPSKWRFALQIQEMHIDIWNIHIIHTHTHIDENYGHWLPWTACGTKEVNVPESTGTLIEMHNPTVMRRYTSAPIVWIISILLFWAISAYGSCRSL